MLFEFEFEFDYTSVTVLYCTMMTGQLFKHIWFISLCLRNMVLIDGNHVIQ